MFGLNEPLTCGTWNCFFLFFWPQHRRWWWWWWWWWQITATSTPPTTKMITMMTMTMIATWLNCHQCHWKTTFWTLCSSWRWWWCNHWFTPISSTTSHPKEEWIAITWQWQPNRRNRQWWQIENEQKQTNCCSHDQCFMLRKSKSQQQQSPWKNMWSWWNLSCSIKLLSMQSLMLHHKKNHQQTN